MRGDLRLAGADEAGRGCLAGPLVAAAVVLDYSAAPFRGLERLTDSKLMTLEAREAAYRRDLAGARGCRAWPSRRAPSTGWGCTAATSPRLRRRWSRSRANTRWPSSTPSTSSAPT